MPEQLDCPILPNYELALTGQPVVNPQKMAKILNKLALQRIKKRPMSHRRRLVKQKWY